MVLQRSGVRLSRGKLLHFQRDEQHRKRREACRDTPKRIRGSAGATALCDAAFRSHAAALHSRADCTSWLSRSREAPKVGSWRSRGGGESRVLRYGVAFVTAIRRRRLHYVARSYRPYRSATRNRTASQVPRRFHKRSRARARARMRAGAHARAPLSSTGGVELRTLVNSRVSLLRSSPLSEDLSLGYRVDHREYRLTHSYSRRPG